MHLVPESLSAIRFLSDRLPYPTNHVGVTPLPPENFIAQCLTSARKEIHVDSSDATFHIRCLNTSDFESWMSALRCVVHVASLSLGHAKIVHSGSIFPRANV